MLTPTRAGIAAGATAGSGPGVEWPLCADSRRSLRQRARGQFDDRIVQSWDTANKVTELSDFSVCATWGVKDKAISPALAAPLSLPAVASPSTPIIPALA